MVYGPIGGGDMNGWMYRWMDGCVGGCTYGWMYGWLDNARFPNIIRSMYANHKLLSDDDCKERTPMDGCMDRCMDVCMDVWM